MHAQTLALAPVALREGSTAAHTGARLQAAHLPDEALQLVLEVESEAEAAHLCVALDGHRLDGGEGERNASSISDDTLRVWRV